MMLSPRLALILAAGLVSGCGFAPPLSEEQSREIAAEVEAAQSQLLEAARAVDADGVVTLLADEGRFHFNGNPLTNEEGRAFTRRAYASLTRQEIVVEDQGVRVLGPNAAVVSGQGHVRGVDTAGTAAEPVDVIWTFVWERQDGSWRVVDSHQSTRRRSGR